MHLRSASCQNALRPYSCQDAQVRASPCQIDPSALSPCPTGRSSSTCSTPLVHRDAAAARWSHRDSCSLAAVSRSASTCCSLEFPGVRRDRQRASHAERRIVHLPKVHRTESLASKSPPVLVIQHHNAAPALSQLHCACSWPCAAGPRIVGRDVLCDWPERAALANLLPGSRSMHDARHQLGMRHTRNTLRAPGGARVSCLVSIVCPATRARSVACSSGCLASKELFNAAKSG